MQRVYAGGPSDHEGPPVVAISNMSNHFGRVQVLDRVNLAIRAGEVHCLLGHNGSGKSTLIKILCGYHSPDPETTITVNGVPTKLPLPPESIRELGFGFVHQDLGLIPALSVVDNLRLVAAKGERRWWLSPRQQRHEAEALLRGYSAKIDVRAEVQTLPPWDRAAVAIARAMRELRAANQARGGGSLLVLDEVTAFLPKERKDALYLLIREVVGADAGVLFVSHDIEEVLSVGDTITVLRDGRVAGSVRARDSSIGELVDMILGHRLDTSVRSTITKETTLGKGFRISGLSGGALTDFSMGVANGEILGVTGILGSGFEDVPYLVTGARRATSGTLELNGQSVDLRRITPAAARSLGIRLVPADRLGDGMIGKLPLVDNVTIPFTRQFWNGLALNRRRMVDTASQLLRRFSVRPADPRMQVQDLSGGNQQKALLAKWLQGAPALLLLHEPTQGVDVGARQEIFRLLREAAAKGAAIVIASSDHGQLEELCDRVLIVRNGAVGNELRGSAVTKDRIGTVTYGIAPVEVRQSG